MEKVGLDRQYQHTGCGKQGRFGKLGRKYGCKVSRTLTGLSPVEGNELISPIWSGNFSENMVFACDTVLLVQQHTNKNPIRAQSSKPPNGSATDIAKQDQTEGFWQWDKSLYTAFFRKTSNRLLFSGTGFTSLTGKWSISFLISTCL